MPEPETTPPACETGDVRTCTMACPEHGNPEPDSKIRAPWTPEQVAALNAFQSAGRMHPFTCGNEHDGTHFVLIAHADGWHCSAPPCEYRQDWAHAFMADQLDWAAFDQTGHDTPGCDCGHDGMGAKWHASDCAWRTTPDNPVASGNEADNAGAQIAYRIRAELVCCHLYDRVNDTHELTIRQAMKGRDWHDLCYWGEAAARIAEGRCPGYETVPNVCRCSCAGCQTNCNAHDEAHQWTQAEFVATDPAPLALPADAARLLHNTLGQLLDGQGGEQPDSLRDQLCDAFIRLIRDYVDRSIIAPGYMADTALAVVQPVIDEVSEEAAIARHTQWETFRGIAADLHRRAETAEATLTKLGGRVQAIADEARGSIREWLLDALNDIPDGFHPSTAERAERAEAALARVRDLVADMQGVTGARWWAEQLTTALAPPVPADGPEGGAQ